MSDAAKLLRRSLDAMTHGDIEGYLALVDDDVDFEFPFAPAGRPSRVHGKDNLRAYLEPLIQAFGKLRVDDLTVYETDHENTAIAEFTLTKESNGERRRYVSVAIAPDGRILTYRDYWPPEFTKP